MRSRDVARAARRRRQCPPRCPTCARRGVPLHRGALRRRRQRAPPREHRVAPLRPRAARTSAASATSVSASTAPPSGGRPSSVSIDVARSASSGGYAAGRRLMPKPRMTYCRPSAPVDRFGEDAGELAPARRHAALDDDVVRPLDLHRQPGRRADARRRPRRRRPASATARRPRCGRRPRHRVPRPAARTTCARTGRAPPSAPRATTVAPSGAPRSASAAATSLVEPVSEK